MSKSKDKLIPEPPFPSPKQEKAKQPPSQEPNLDSTEPTTNTPTTTINLSTPQNLTQTQPTKKYKPNPFSAQTIAWTLINCPNARHRFLGPPTSPKFNPNPNPNDNEPPFLHFLPSDSEIYEIRQAILYEAEVVKLRSMSVAERREYRKEKRERRVERRVEKEREREKMDVGWRELMGAVRELEEEFGVRVVGALEF